jgi:hypothetical protein
MMAKDPARRHANPRELVSELRVLGSHMGLRPLDLLDGAWRPTPAPPVSFFHRHLPWMIPVASLVVIVWFMNAFWPTGSPDEGFSIPPSADSVEKSGALTEHPIADLGQTDRESDRSCDRKIYRKERWNIARTIG